MPSDPQRAVQQFVHDNPMLIPVIRRLVDEVIEGELVEVE